MDSSLKQRLLGAAVLIALAVIFVPMFLSDSAPRTSAEMETRNLAIPPAPDREFQQRVLPLDPAPASAPPAAAPTAPAPPERVDAPAGEPVASAPAAPATKAPGAPQPVDAPRETAPAAGTAPSPAATPPVTAGTAADSRFYVHLGVYAESANANELVASLKKAGHSAFTEPTRYQGKAAERVRVGPYPSRAAAEAARLRIRALQPSVPGSVVQLAADAPGDAPASALPAARAGAWAVQLGALKGEADATRLRDRLRGAGFTAFVDEVESNGSRLWRVRVGPEVDRGAADRLRATIRERMKLDGIIVTM